MITATVRWIHSIHALESSSGGMIWPWQSGQSGQPRPESVARTMTPIVTSTSVVTRVARRASGSGSRGGHSTRARRGALSATPTRYTLPDRSAWPDPRRCARLILVRCSAPRRAAPVLRPRGPAAAGRRRAATVPHRADAWGPPADAADALPAPRHELRRLRSRRGSCSSPSIEADRSRARRTARARSRSTTLAGIRTTPVVDRRRRVHLDDRGRARHVRPRCRPPGGRYLGRRVHDRGTRLARRDHPGDLRRPGADRPWCRSASRPRPPDTPTLADVGGDVTKISTDTIAGPGVLRDLRRRRPRGPQAVRPRLRDAEVLHQRAVRPDAGPDQADRRRHPDVTFINVEPYQLQDVDGQLQPVLDANGQLQATDVTERVGPATPSRGSSRSTGTGVVRGSYELIAITTDGARRRSCRSSPPAADPIVTARPRAGPRRRSPSSVRYHTRTGAPSPGARRGDRAGTRRRSRGRRARRSATAPSVVRRSKPGHRSAAASTDDDDPLRDPGRPRAARDRLDGRPPSMNAAAPSPTMTTTRATDEGVPGSRIHGQSAPDSPRGRSGPGAPRRVQRRPVRAARARLGAGFVRRQVELPERAQRVDVRPVVGEVSVVRPPLRSTSTTHSTISPPIASTAGSIASSDPPVVRMSSTSRTRSPGSMRKPRRNSRWVVPSASRTSSAKIAADAELAGGLEGEDDPAGRRPGDEIDHRRAVRAADAAPPRSRTARSSRPGSESTCELLDVGVAVAAALEQEVALAERAGRRKSASVRAAMAARAAIVDGWLDGRHAASLRGVADPRRTPSGRSGGSRTPVESRVRADDLGDPLVDARRDVDQVARGERLGTAPPGPATRASARG